MNSLINKPIESTEGCVWPGSKWGNFSIQKEIVFETTEKYFAWEAEFVDNYTKISSGKLIGQSLCSLMLGGQPQKTESSIPFRWQAERIKNLLPENIVDPAIAFLLDMNKVFNHELITEECHIFAPELHLWPKIEIDKNMCSSLKGVYVIGDVSGVARGIMQAQVTGVVAAEHIL